MTLKILSITLVTSDRKRLTEAVLLCSESLLRAIADWYRALENWAKSNFKA